MSNMTITPAPLPPPPITMRAISVPRPSPWHEIAHSLSTSSLRTSQSHAPTPTPPDDDAALSTSQALREWEERADAIRHHLSFPLLPRKASTPKLAAERDKAGYIEYKLKLIDPTNERFERLVTQMMWRLKQGKNEAIYELGLADDGTVIGLTRAEMDASLRTLELMASEVGATVIVLKEIVLTGATHAHLAHKSSSTSLSSISSVSLSSPASTGTSWVIHRPDLDESGQPRKSMEVDRKVWKGRRDKKFGRGSTGDVPNDMSDKPSESSSNTPSDTDDGFLFEMDDAPLPFPKPNAPSVPVAKTIPTPTETRRNDEKKRTKALARQEQRRLDLLRGDGTNPLWQELTHLDHQHQPPRPSSLRLTTPDSPEHTFLDDLLHVPLDSLSLSFADVTTISADSSPSSKTEHPLPFSDDDDDIDDAGEEEEDQLRPLPVSSSLEMICVEALVVRKVQHDVSGSTEAEVEGEGDDEEEWSFGGEEDAWGFGGEEDKT